MPTLHRFKDRPGFYIKGVSQGKPIALELSPEGEQYLTETLALTDGARFSGETFRWLYKKKWATPLASLPEDFPVVVSNGSPLPSASDANPVVFTGVVRIRLSSADHVALDQSAEQVVRTLAQTGGLVSGPIPLPVHLEPYLVLRDQQRKVYELRLFQRLLQVRAPRRLTVEAMNTLALPREVDVQIDMKP